MQATHRLLRPGEERLAVWRQPGRQVEGGRRGSGANGQTLRRAAEHVGFDPRAAPPTRLSLDRLAVDLQLELVAHDWGLSAKHGNLNRPAGPGGETDEHGPGMLRERQRGGLLRKRYREHLCRRARRRVGSRGGRPVPASPRENGNGGGQHNGCGPVRDPGDAVHARSLQEADYCGRRRQAADVDHDLLAGPPGLNAALRLLLQDKPVFSEIAGRLVDGLHGEAGRDERMSRVRLGFPR